MMNTCDNGMTGTVEKWVRLRYSLKKGFLEVNLHPMIPLLIIIKINNISLYINRHDHHYPGTETMDEWDEEKLQDVVNRKHGESNKTKQKTEIVCVYIFLCVCLFVCVGGGSL